MTTDRLAHMRDLDAERAVLGAMMMRNQTAVEVYDVLGAEDFFEARHGFIFTAVAKLMLDAKPVDPIAVADQLTREGLIDPCGGGPYLAELLDAAIPSSTMYHAKIVKEFSRRRQLAACMIKGHQRTLDLETDLDAVAAAVLTDVQDAITTTGIAHEGAVRIGEDLDAHIATRCDPDDYPEAAGLPTGLLDLDKLIGGLKSGQLVLVGGRPGDGKTLMLTGMARHAAVNHGQSALMISMEMSRPDIYDRILSADAKVNLETFTQRRTPNDNEINRLLNAGAKLRRCPLYIEYCPSVDIRQICAKARMHQLRHGLSLLLIDYVQLISSTSDKETRTQQLDGIAKRLKELAGELGVPIVAGAQLGRSADQRSDKVPQLSDLRESGGLENAADVVILLYRPEKADPQTPRKGEIDLIVPKNRNGRNDTVTAAAQFHYSRIVDMTTG